MTRLRTSPALALAACIAVAATTLVGVSPAQASSVAKPKVTLTVTELPAQVRLVPGEAVDVRLQTNVTTGYSWSTKVVGKKGTVAVSAGAYAAPTTTLVGAAGTTTWRVVAKAKGTAVVRFLTSPPGEDTTQNLGSLTVIVK
jgi:predicted secreted protein